MISFSLQRIPANRSAYICLFSPQDNTDIWYGGELETEEKMDEGGTDKTFGFHLSTLFSKLCYIMFEWLNGKWGKKHTKVLQIAAKVKVEYQIFFNGKV